MDQNQLSAYVQQEPYPLFSHEHGSPNSEFHELVRRTFQKTLRFDTSFVDSNVRIRQEDLRALQINLVRSHSCGVVEPLGPEATRAMLLLRANVLAKGFSGVRPVVLETLVEIINNDLLPFVPSKDSVGASGDVAPSLISRSARLAKERLSTGAAESRLARRSRQPASHRSSSRRKKDWHCSTARRR